MKLIAPGIWKHRLGEPEAITPASLREQHACVFPPRREALAALPRVDRCPLAPDTITHKVRPRGISVEIPIADAAGVEQFYGMGMQLERFNHTNRKLTLRVNSDPTGGAGDSHAPVPLVVSTAGYGIYVDTARYATFHLGGSARHRETDVATAVGSTNTGTDTADIYAQRKLADRTLLIDVPAAQGVEIYVFAGPALMQVMQRYNLYSGGGCLPPMSGLGMAYHAFSKYTQADALETARYFRSARLPCDVFGFEPNWQTKAYSCSFVWNRELFPDPDAMLRELHDLHYDVHLWEHVFVHRSSPMYAGLEPHAGDYEVWSGLVPDLAVPAARQVFSDYHRTELIDKGINGFKLDECDNSDFIAHSSWSFPEASSFPSGMDGEQMHAMLGMLYQQAVLQPLAAANTRTYGLARSSGPFAAPMPFALYTDLYDHRVFVRGILSAGFAGMLWTPELRHAASVEDLLRRIQTLVLSPQALINAWYMARPPWFQFDRRKSGAGEWLNEAPRLEAAVRELFRLRMSLLPYLYAAFARYADEGVPPFRALVMDHPDDAATSRIDDQFMIGDDLLAAPLFDGQAGREVYLPAGQWYHFFSHQRYEGARMHTIASDPADCSAIPLFVRAGAILPIAAPVDCVTPDTVFDIVPHAFGSRDRLRPAVLFEDDGATFDYRQGRCNRVVIHPDRSVTRTGAFDRERYRVTGWKDCGA